MINDNNIDNDNIENMIMIIFDIMNSINDNNIDNDNIENLILIIFNIMIYY